VVVLDGAAEHAAAEPGVVGRPAVGAAELLGGAGQQVGGGIGGDGGLVDGGIQAQTHQALRNVEALLHQEGSSLEDVVKTTVFLKDIDDWPAMNEAYVEVMGDSRPARSAFAVAALPLGALVEIEAWAYVGAR
jgi:2-iminobutanoate/2-iminopropanoate deaminase